MSAKRIHQVRAAGLPSQRQALVLLAELGAPERLLRHAELVAEAAAALLAEFRGRGLEIDETLVLAGAVLHDAGKVLHPEELREPGTKHEAAGEKLLIDQGLPGELARICRSHGEWRNADLSLEELVVALADKLWKGARVPELELRIIDLVAERTGQARWDLFVPLDNAFEAVAGGGSERLGMAT